MTNLYALRRALSDAAGHYNPTVPATVTAWSAAKSAYLSALIADTPVWTDSAAPVLLTPMRLEVRYLAGATAGDPPELAIRVIPDDIAHYTFEPGLNAAEKAAGKAFWDQARTDMATAWLTITTQLGNARAAWAVEVSRHDSGAPPGTPRTTTKPATSLLLPDKFTFRGWRGDNLIFDLDGQPIPPDLPLGPDFGNSDQTDPPPKPWTDNSAWVVNLALAEQFGMAKRIPLTGTNLAFDKITVIGVRSSDATDGADLWGRTLQGHLYTRGLTYPPVGSPTNNTDADRSQWSSAPQMRTPDQVDAAVAKAVPGSDQPGVALADAFGLPATATPATPGRRDLLTAPGSTDPGDYTVRDDCYNAMASFYRTLIVPQRGFTADWTAGTVTPQPLLEDPGWLTSDTRQAHFTQNVRSDGPLPPLRAGRQPYGVLPVTSLVSWALAADPGGHDDIIQQIIARQQKIQLTNSARFGEFPDQDQDPVLLELLQRLPVTLAVRSPTERFDALTPATSGAPPQFPLAALAGLEDTAHQQLFSNNINDITAELDALLNATRTGAGTTAGLYWALQAYAATYWQSVWATFAPIGVTEAQWTAMNATVIAQLAPLRALEGDVSGPNATSTIATVDRQLAGALEALTCRVDAWATSMATARLRAVRQTTPTGLHVGMYGWLVDVKPEALEQRDTDDGWVLAPSPQHAISASVLLAGAQAHSETAFDMDLRSDRVRRALTVLSGLRAGSTFEELLGYQLERALHDHQLDRFIAALRTAYPLPLADTGDPAGQLAAQAAHGARLIVNGDEVRQAPTGDITKALTTSGASTADVQAIQQLITDLDVTVDAVADLLLAEGVHHLVGGSALRSALAVDTIGKAGPVPDRFDVITTPTRAVAVAHTVGMALTVAESPWPTGPRATLDPVAEAVAHWALGDPTDWQLTVTTGAGSQTVALTDLGASAIDIVVEATAPLDNSALAARVHAHTGTSDGGIGILRSDGQGGPAALVTLAATVRAALGRCGPLDDPLHAISPDTAPPITKAPADLEDLAKRAGDWWRQVRDTTAAFAPDSTADQPAAIAQLAALGVADIRFDTPVSGGAPLYNRILALENALQSQFKSADNVAGPAPDNADGNTWQDNLARQLRGLAGPWCTGAALFAASDTSWNMLTGHTPTAADHDDDAVADWLRDHWQVQPGVTALTDILLAAGALGSGTAPSWLVLQQHADTPPAADPWVARAHPGSRSAAALTALQIGAPAASSDPTHPSRALLMLDQWVETVPAAPAPDPSVPDPTQAPLIPLQQAALTLRFDSPDSRAPQAVLLVAPPDPQRNWRADDIHAAVEETLWWTTARPVDADDTPEQEGL